jgi:hypothetical protein
MENCISCGKTIERSDDDCSDHHCDVRHEAGRLGAERKANSDDCGFFVEVMISDQIR